MDWIFANLGKVVMVIFVIISIVQSIRKSRGEEGAPPAGSSQQDPDEARRVAEIQERIRRTIAERRGEAVPPPAPVREISYAPPPPPPAPAREAREPDPIGDLGRRVFAELEEKFAPPAPPPPPPAPVAPYRAAVSRAEVERQEDLAEQLRVIEEAKAQAVRRAQHRREASRELAQSELAHREQARGALLADLHDPHALRRAFVLREVLGPPVSLR